MLDSYAGVVNIKPSQEPQKVVLLGDYSARLNETSVNRSRESLHRAVILGFEGQVGSNLRSHSRSGLLYRVIRIFGG